MDFSKLRECWICHLPAGELGTAHISKFSVSQDESIMSSFHRSYVPEGNYTSLRISGHGLVMSDTPKEFRDHFEFFRHAAGNVLVHGLGLGCCLNVIRHIPKVQSITVIEINPDVIAIVGPHFVDPKISIIQGDARTWQPPKGAFYDAVWHDIWSDICTDNLKEMVAFHRRYGRKAAWQGSWSRSECEYRKRQKNHKFRGWR
jgi:hypothetical protein